MASLFQTPLPFPLPNEQLASARFCCILAPFGEDSLLFYHLYGQALAHLVSPCLPASLAMKITIQMRMYLHFILLFLFLKPVITPNIGPKTSHLGPLFIIFLFLQRSIQTVSSPLFGILGLHLNLFFNLFFFHLSFLPLLFRLSLVLFIEIERVRYEKRILRFFLFDGRHYLFDFFFSDYFFSICYFFQGSPLVFGRFFLSRFGFVEGGGSLVLILMIEVVIGINSDLLIFGAKDIVDSLFAYHLYFPFESLQKFV